MNLDEAVQRHAEWKTKLRSAITKQEKLDAGTISKDNCCDVGKWLYGAGRMELGGKPEFSRAVDKHKAFHLQAGKVAQLINSGKFAEADAALDFGTPYADASNEVGKALFSLRKVAGH